MTINSAQLAALRDIESCPGKSGRFLNAIGNSYATLRALENKMLVAVNRPIAGSSSAGTGQYRLTNEGHAVLAENAEREK